MERKKQYRIAEYIFVLLTYAAIAAVYAHIIRSTAAVFVGSNRSYETAREFLRASGVKGVLLVSLLEMLQMLVVCVPAEFVQVSAGLAFPVYVALPACVLGVFLGASAIFVIVRCLRFRLELLEKRNEKTRQFVQRINKDTPMAMIMYILFITPIIPFGAIAYFAASSNISYRRYAVTCATGVIPSVLSSYFLGNVMYRCIGKGSGAFIAAVFVVTVLMLALLLTMAAILQNIFSAKTLHKPYRLTYNTLYFFVGLYLRLRVKIDRSRCEPMDDSPALIIGAHTSFYDFYYMAAAVFPRRPNIVTNRYYFSKRLLRAILGDLGAIPKSLFINDMETVKSMLRVASQGGDIAFFPEGRLSTDGTAFPPVGGGEGVAKLIRKLDMPVYFFSTHGGYLAAPKWRSGIARERVEISLRPLISKGEAETLSIEELSGRVCAVFGYDESRTEGARSRDVRGLEGILYRCISCGGEYEMCSERGALICGKCGKRFEFDDKYTCGGISISQWYAWQKQKLIEERDFNMTDRCELRCADSSTGRMTAAGEGICTLSETGLSYRGTLLGEQVTVERSPASLQALAFSCGEEFEFYHNNSLVYFYPRNRAGVVKWSMIWDVLAENQRRKAAEDRAAGGQKQSGGGELK